MRVSFDKRKPGVIDPRPWIAWIEPGPGQRMFLGKFFHDEKGRLTVEWLGANDFGITKFESAEAAMYFFQKAQDAGIPLIDINLAPADECEKCGRVRVSPYDEPPKSHIICPDCRRLDKSPKA